MGCLIGFDGFDGDEMMGAAPKPATTRKPVPKPSKKSVASGKKHWPTATDRSHSPHKAAMLNVTHAAKRAIDAGKKGHATSSAYKPAKHAPIVKLAPVVTSRGVALGLAPGQKPLTPKQAAAVAKHTTTIARHAAATRRLTALTKKAEKTGKDALAFAKKTTTYLHKALAGKKGTHVGAEEEILGLLEGVDIGTLSDDEVIGLCSMLGLDGDPNAYVDPNAPPPDTTAEDTAGTPDGSGVVMAPDGTVLYDPANDPSVVPMPQRGGELTQDDAQAIWQHMPEDGIPWPAGMAFPNGGLGSYSMAYGAPQVGKVGYGWAGDRWAFVGTTGGFELPGSTSQQVNAASLAGAVPSKTGGKTERDLATVAAALFSGGLAAAVPGLIQDGSGQLTLAGGSFGPLMGMPGTKCAGIQYAAADDKFFWQGSVAPQWASTEVDDKIAQANLKTIAANTAAAQVEAARRAKDAADAAEAQAKQEAQIALQQQADDAAQTHAQSQADTATTAQQTQLEQLDVDAQKAQLPIAVEQDKLDLEAQKADQQALVEQTAVWNEWAKKDPAAAFAALDMSPPGDDGGAPPPMMADDEAPQLDGEAPEMFEEKLQPQAEDAPPNWPFDDEEIGSAEEWAQVNG